MDEGQVAVATMTWARSPAEESLLLRSLELLAQSGLPIAVADRGTSAAFTKALSCRAGIRVVVPDAPGLVAQVKASFQLAAAFRTPRILYVEPDKEAFFERRLGAFLRGAPAGDDVGVVLAARSAASFATFPPTQRYTESVINTLTGEQVGAAGDYSYGPFLVHRRLLPQLAHLDGRLGWGWRHFVFRVARRQGLRVAHVTGDYPCPPEQRHEDEAERRHRLRQLSENLLGLID